MRVLIAVIIAAATDTSYTVAQHSTFYVSQPDSCLKGCLYNVFSLHISYSVDDQTRREETKTAGIRLKISPEESLLFWLEVEWSDSLTLTYESTTSEKQTWTARL